MELALDLILSALIILLDVKGCWIEYEKGGKTNLLIKGDRVLVENYLCQNAGGAVVEKIANDVVHGNIGVLLPENMCRASTLLPAMAQECLIAFEIETEFETVPPVLADSGQLTQVVSNLMRNSMEAVGNSGVISIGLKSWEGWIEISFADNGPGIPDEMADKLFEPFFTTKERGTGLGLTISLAIVNNHGGHITASNSRDGGAVFTVRLPARN